MITGKEYQQGLKKKIKKSKELLMAINKPFHLTVVTAMYNEIERMKKPKESTVGENSINVKINQLNELFEDIPNGDWSLYLVDDGCPHGSGKFAESIIQKWDNDTKNKARVLYLENAIKHRYEPVKTLKGTDESRKGGSILYGMWQANKDVNSDNHVIIFTDADTSTDLRQSGLLVNEIINNGFTSAAGSRREHDSFVIKPQSRNNRGKLFIYLWKQILKPHLSTITDTQCPFKAFNSRYIDKLVTDNIEFKFAFDIELLLKTELIDNKKLTKVGIAWKDSVEASTVGGNETYLDMLKSITNMYERYVEKNTWNENFVNFIRSITISDFDKLINNMPEYIADSEPSEFKSIITVDDLYKQIN